MAHQIRTGGSKTPETWLSLTGTMAQFTAEYSGGRATFGYKAEKGQKCIQVDEKQAKTVCRVFQLKEQHPSWTLTQIAESLNEEGFTTQQGRMFTKVQV